MSGIAWTEIDGVRAVWADAGGPLRAGLLFRTGVVDETLATRGFTHLLEHLVLSGVGGDPERHNGFVGPSLTGLLFTGGPEEVTACISDACRAIAALPEERLAAEKDVLAAESATRNHDPVANLFVYRYGAAGHGLIAFPEIAVRGADPVALRDFAADRFTRDNAVLWLSGPPPEGLSIELPSGSTRPVPQPASIAGTLPGWIIDDRTGGVLSSSVVPRVPAAVIACQVISTRMREALREQRSVSYAPTLSYEPMDAESAHLVMAADSDVERRAELAACFGEVFESLASVGTEEIERALEQAEEAWTGTLAPTAADRALQDVQRSAIDELFCGERQSLEEIRAESRAVSRSDVESFAETIRGTAIIALPGETKVATWMGVQLPACLSAPVTGRQVRAYNASADSSTLVYGPDGVTLRLAGLGDLTVRFASLATAFRYEDEALRLVGTDGATLALEPTLWRGGYKACREIAARIPPHLLVDLGPRSDSEIPPNPKAGLSDILRGAFPRRRGSVTPARETPPAPFSRGRLIIGWLLLGVGVPFMCVWMLMLTMGAGEVSSGAADSVETAFVWAILLVPVVLGMAMTVLGAWMVKRQLGRR